MASDADLQISDLHTGSFVAADTFRFRCDSPVLSTLVGFLRGELDPIT
jgi:hypothetical protein